VTPADEAALQILTDRLEIHDLMNTYADGVDRRDFAQVASCFSPDVVSSGFFGKTFTSRDDLVEFITGVSVFDVTMHMMGNQLVGIDGDRATCDTWAMLMHVHTRADGSRWEYNVPRAQYVETLERRDGRWVITARGGEPAWSSAVDPLAVRDPEVRWLVDRAKAEDAHTRYANEHGWFAGLPRYARRRIQSPALDADGNVVTLSAAAPQRKTPASANPLVAHLVDRALVKDAVASSETATPPIALFNNQRVVFADDDHARSTAYAYLVDRDGDGWTPWFQQPRRYVDVIERVAGEWQITSRETTDNRP